MAIDVRQLRFAVAAAETGSFMRAAKQLHVKHSTLSKKIAAMERQLGVTLFDRSTRGVTVTAMGRTFLEVARRIVTDIDNLQTTAKAVRYGEVGRLMVGFSGSLSAGNLRLLLGEVLQRYPDIQLDALEAGHDAMVSGLQSRIVDIVFHTGQLSDIGIARRFLWSERLMLVLPKCHRLLSHDGIFWTDLRREVFVLPSGCNGPAIAEIVRQRLGGFGLKAQIIVQETSSASIASMVPFEKFLTIVPESASASLRQDVALKEIAEPGGSAHLGVAAWWHEDNENPALARFLRLLDERHPDFESQVL